MSKKLTGTTFHISTPGGSNGPAQDTAAAYLTWFGTGTNHLEVEGIQTITEHGANDTIANRKTLKDGIAEKFVVGRDYGTITFTAYAATVASQPAGIARVIAVADAATGQGADTVHCALQDPQSGALGGKIHFFKGTVSNVRYSEKNPDDLAMVTWDVNVNSPFYIADKS